MTNRGSRPKPESRLTHMGRPIEDTEWFSGLFKGIKKVTDNREIEYRRRQTPGMLYVPRNVLLRATSAGEPLQGVTSNQNALEILSKEVPFEQRTTDRPFPAKARWLNLRPVMGGAPGAWRVKYDLSITVDDVPKVPGDSEYVFTSEKELVRFPLNVKCDTVNGIVPHHRVALGTMVSLEGHLSKGFVSDLREAVADKTGSLITFGQVGEVTPYES